MRLLILFSVCERNYGGEIPTSQIPVAKATLCLDKIQVESCKLIRRTLRPVSSLERLRVIQEGIRLSGPQIRDVIRTLRADQIKIPMKLRSFTSIHHLKSLFLSYCILISLQKQN